ncbi:MAG: sugar ABC transporter permease [bacterium]
MLEKNKGFKGWLYLSPALILLAIFTIYPLINTIFVSFQTGYNYQNPFNYGSFSLNNFAIILNYSKFPTFIESIKTTFIIVFVTVPLSTAIALLIALGLNAIKPLKKVFQTIFFIPYITNAMAVGMVFSVLFSLSSSNGVYSYGLINSVLVNVFQMAPIDFITGSYFHGMLVLLLYITWNGLAFKILIILSGLQGIDKQYYQAAQIDNASKSKTFFRITIPLLSPVLSYILITSLIGAFKEYTSVIAIFGEEAGSGKFATVVSFIYSQLKPSSVSLAAAGAVVLLIIILIFTAINMYISNKKVHY